GGVVQPPGGVVQPPGGVVQPPGGVVQPPLVDWRTNPNLPDILKDGRANLPIPIVFPADAPALDAMKTEFRTAESSINTVLNTARVAPPDPAPLGGQASLAPARAQLLAKLRPGDTIRARLGARIPLGQGPDPLQPLEAGPRYPQPMYAPLAQL